MDRFFGLIDANLRLTEVEPILVTLRTQRGEIVRLRDQLLESGVDPAGSAEAPAGWASRLERPNLAAEVRLARLRMQGLIDQMQAGVGRLDELGVVLRDIETGLIDFPALINGRQVWLCWRLGEDEIGWWHELTTGVGARQRIADLA